MRTRRGIPLVFALAVALTPITQAGAARVEDAGTGATATPDTTVGTGRATAEEAAQQITAAREDANIAAAAFWQAQSRLDLVTQDKAELDVQRAILQAQVDDLKKAVAAVVVNRYIGSGTTGINLLSGTVGPTEQAQTAVLVGVIDESSSVSLDDYAVLLGKLDALTTKSNKAATALEAAKSDSQTKQQQADAEIARLKVVEKDRLNDEAVQKALEAGRQKAAEAVQKAATEQQRLDQLAAASNVASDAAVAAQWTNDDGGDQGITVTPVSKTAPANQASGSAVGGTTGGGGEGGRPITVGIYGQGAAWVCPLQGTYAFSDTFGAPRSGGRTHEGVDMISARGTLIVAVVDGVATARQDSLGGNTVGFDGDDGNHYYYAHLDSYATLGRVTKGTVIGLVGDSGDAKFSTPHLHFEIHPGHGLAVDPTPTVAANC